MKKSFLFLVTLSFVFAVSSCKTHEKCPAYGSKQGRCPAYGSIQDPVNSNSQAGIRF